MTTPTSGASQAQPAVEPAGAQRTVDGHPGTLESDGSFLSDDGTVYVPAGGQPEHGISTPDGHFIPGGTTHVMPDGTIAYGMMAGNDFLSVDHEAIALDDGSVLHGNLDENTGVFTTDSGNAYLVTADGVVSVVAHVMPDGSTAYGRMIGGDFYSADGATVALANGDVLHGGSPQDGVFVTDSGAVYLATESGLVVGASHVMPDGSTAYGRMIGGDFYSADGATVALANGDVLHGGSPQDGVFVTDSGAVYLATESGLVVGASHVMPDGSTAYGRMIGGDFYSADGATVALANGDVLHGGSPQDGVFVTDSGAVYLATESGLVVGASHVMPDGSTAYGQMIGGDFFSIDRTTIVLGDGTVLHGTYDDGTGLFTTDSGDTYFVGDDGVTHGTFRPSDGAFVLDGDAGVVMTPGSWKVDLAQMAETLRVLQGKAEAISGYHDTIKQQFRNVQFAWTSPSGDTFSDISVQVERALTNLDELLANVVDRMQQSYDNYRQAEEVVRGNLSYRHSGGGPAYERGVPAYERG
ncbi:WXG100 family type VII secretion target [Actinoallomurus sp. NPDC052308]|uniref:WXG100 family type VII secretion target n=1 Tax=Actinoallomurus sp. NPDC052308 TaxID=3155530 RepID=UPI00341FB723